MPQLSKKYPAWNRWFHLTATAYAQWLRGDPRGWRERHHRLHVPGDYKNPPPLTPYNQAIHLRSQSLLKTPSIFFAAEDRPILGFLFLESAAFRDMTIAAISVAGEHIHALAQCPNDTDPETLLGGIKQRMWTVFHENLPKPWSKLWAKRPYAKPIRDIDHFHEASRYILDHASDGAWVWSVPVNPQAMPHGAHGVAAVGLENSAALRYTNPYQTRGAPSMPTPQLDDLLALIQKTWGFRKLKPLQQPAMQAFIDRRDSLVVLPTGGGKSLCYQAPASLLAAAGHGPTVVISPLIALMKDQVDSLRSVGIPASQFDSSLSADDRRSTAADLRAGRLHLLFVSPERLVGEGCENFQSMLRDANVNTFAIDEAHCISQWGHDFRPEYRQLARLKEIFPDIAVHAFTATATTQVRRDIAEQLKLEDPELLVGNFDRPNLTYRVLPRRDLFAQIKDVLERHVNEAGIIYCMRRKDVDEISATLAADKKLNRKVAGYHAGMSPELRRRVQEQFIEEECDLIVATIAFGMGIDRSNIRFVLHAGMPKSIEAYQQETGRAGRDGLEAECILLYSASDTFTWKSVIEKSASEAGSNGTRIDPRFLPAALKHIDDMDRFARGATCRHKTLVEYFGQPYEGPPDPAPAADSPDTAEENDPRSTPGGGGCGACDMCLGDTTTVPDSLVIAQKILSCIARTDQRFGAAHVISILRGENTDRIRQLHHDELSTYGLLRGYPKTELRDFVYQLVGQGVITQENLVLSSGHTAPILKLNAQSIEVLKGRRTPRLVQIVRKSAEESRKTRAEVISWENVDQQLFEALRALRKKIADSRSVPPYVIFSDATLRELARVRPSSTQSLRLIYGIGENKLKDFGPQVLPLIAEHAKARTLSIDQHARPDLLESPPPARSMSGLSRPNLPKQQALDMFRQGASLEAVVQLTGRAHSTITEYLAEFIEIEKPASIDIWVAPDIYKKVQNAARSTGLSPLKPLYFALNESVPYDQLRLITAHLRSRPSAGSGSSKPPS